MLKYKDILRIKGKWVNPLNSQIGCQSLTLQSKARLDWALKFIDTFSFKLRESLRVTDSNLLKYNPKKDRLTLPIPERFKTVEDYLICQFHEYGHATGHPKRLNRISLNYYYSPINNIYEEITAELVALKLGQKLKINYDWENCYRYIMTFLNNKKMNDVFKLNTLRKADDQANEAITYLLKQDNHEIKKSPRSI